MTFDEEAHAANLARWAGEELLLFEVAAWAEAPMVGGSSELVGVGADGSTTRIVVSRTVRHGRPDGAWIDVTSHRPDDFDDLKTWLPTNMLLRAVRHEVGVTNPREHNAAADRLTRQAADGAIPWSAATITVDGAPISFDVMRYQRQWVGIAETTGVFVMLDSSEVALSEVDLVSRTAR